MFMYVTNKKLLDQSFIYKICKVYTVASRIINVRISSTSLRGYRSQIANQPIFHSFCVSPRNFEKREGLLPSQKVGKEIEMFNFSLSGVGRF